MEEETTTSNSEQTWKHIPDRLMDLAVMVRLNRKGYEQIWLHLGTCEVCRDRFWEITERHQKRVEGMMVMGRGLGAIVSGVMSTLEKSEEDRAATSLFDFLQEEDEDDVSTPEQMKKDMEAAGFDTPESLVKKVLTMVPDPEEEGIKKIFLTILEKTAQYPEDKVPTPDEIGLRFNRKKPHMLTCLGCQARVISTLQLCAYYQDKLETDEHRKGLERLIAFLKSHQADMFKDVQTEAPEEQSEAAPKEKNRVFTQP